ncbi:MAG: protein-ADP-ribose hydrolase [Selenomonadaceae bacterium]|nr:protein-ADP-ribose hydrolase [Selenomonadaceae bacterium]
MTTAERIRFLNQILLEAMPEYQEQAVAFSKDLPSERRLLRSLMNLCPPMQLWDDFWREQDILLQEEASAKGIIAPEALPTVADLTGESVTPQTIPAKQIILWQGDITRLSADGIVNAANSALLGCFFPCHGCIDNAIHSAAGLELRLACAALMGEQGGAEPTGQAKITPAFNLPSRYVIHTVGPIIEDVPTAEDARLLAGCYRSSLELADKHELKSLAFCCISTGEFHYPNRAAAKIALQTVGDYLKSTGSKLTVIFNVFKDEDAEIYREMLGI